MTPQTSQYVNHYILCLLIHFSLLSLCRLAPIPLATVEEASEGEEASPDPDSEGEGDSLGEEEQSEDASEDEDESENDTASDDEHKSNVKAFVPDPVEV